MFKLATNCGEIFFRVVMELKCAHTPKLVYIWNVDYIDFSADSLPLLDFFHNLGHFLFGMLPLSKYEKIDCIYCKHWYYTDLCNIKPPCNLISIVTSTTFIHGGCCGKYYSVQLIEIRNTWELTNGQSKNILRLVYYIGTK